MLEKISIIGINEQLILMDHCWPLGKDSFLGIED